MSGSVVSAMFVIEIRISLGIVQCVARRAGPDRDLVATPEPSSHDSLFHTSL